jgi:hypothetical protein
LEATLEAQRGVDRSWHSGDLLFSVSLPLEPTYQPHAELIDTSKRLTRESGLLLGIHAGGAVAGNGIKLYASTSGFNT